MSNQGHGRGCAMFNNEGKDYKLITVALPVHVRAQVDESCVLNAIAHIVESRKKAHLLDLNYYWNAYIDETGVPFGQDKNRAITALNLLRDKGVFAYFNGRRKLEKISGYECHRRMNAYQVFAMLDSGTPLLGSFCVRADFSDLGEDIYELDPPYKHGDPHPKTHMVMFVGYGMRGGRPFLVFLNSYGPDWGTRGLGAVFFDQVYQDDDDEGFQLIRVIVDGGTPAPRLETTFRHDQVQSFPAGYRKKKRRNCSSFPLSNTLLPKFKHINQEEKAFALQDASGFFIQEEKAFALQDASGTACGADPGKQIR